jgi:hypothetical protein
MQKSALTLTKKFLPTRRRLAGFKGTWVWRVDVASPDVPVFVPEKHQESPVPQAAVCPQQHIHFYV